MSVAASMAAIDLNHLYIVGPAATAGEWTAELPEEMVSIGTGTFIWDGYLEEGEFKFLNQLGDYNSSIVAAAENQNVESGQTYTLIDNTSGQGNADYKFWNPQAGECRIIANIASSPMTLSFRRPVVQMVGSAVRGWGSPSLNIPVYADNEGVVEWTGLLQAGEIKFLVGNDWSPCYNATSHEAPFGDGTHEMVYNANGENDYKFIVPRTGRYTLQFDISAPTVTVTSHSGPSLSGSFTASAGRYVVAADREGRNLYFGAVPQSLYIQSYDGTTTALTAGGSNGDVFTGVVFMKNSNYYKLYADAACSSDKCFSPNVDEEISAEATYNVAPMHGYSYTVSQTGFYDVVVDFSGGRPLISATRNLTGVDDVTADSVEVVVNGRDIVVEGDYDSISIVDVSGRVVSTAARTIVAPGIYLVVVDSKTYKLAVK